MKWWQKTNRIILDLLRQGLKTTHSRIVMAGLLVGLCYLPVWLGGLVARAAQGSAGLPLITAVVSLGGWQLWRQRHQLAKMDAPPEDRLLGHLLILSAVVLFPFCRFAVWPQAVLWLVVLAGIACSSFGASFFVRYRLSALLAIISAYPKPGVTAKIVWQTLTPPEMLERFMAWGGAAALRSIGQPAVAEGIFVQLPAGGVEVNWGCNGFNMAFTMAAAGLIFGLFLNQNWLKTTLIVVLGVLLALVFNIPRIMLLTIASVYWGEDSFKFWHGPIGGQIFSGTLLTVYYYAVMGYVNRRSAKVRA